MADASGMPGSQKRKERRHFFKAKAGFIWVPKLDKWFSIQDFNGLPEFYKEGARCGDPSGPEQFTWNPQTRTFEQPPVYPSQTFMHGIPYGPYMGNTPFMGYIPNMTGNTPNMMGTCPNMMGYTPFNPPQFAGNAPSPAGNPHHSTGFFAGQPVINMYNCHVSNQAPSRPFSGFAQPFLNPHGQGPPSNSNFQPAPNKPHVPPACSNDQVSCENEPNPPNSSTGKSDVQQPTKTQVVQKTYAPTAPLKKRPNAEILGTDDPVSKKTKAKPDDLRGFTLSDRDLKCMAAISKIYAESTPDKATSTETGPLYKDTWILTENGAFKVDGLPSATDCSNAKATFMPIMPGSEAVAARKWTKDDCKGEHPQQK